jgi:hypothetical protein
MIHNCDKGKGARKRISDFLDLPTPLLAGSRAEELAFLESASRGDWAGMRRGDSGWANAVVGLFSWLFFLAGCGFLVVFVRGSLLEWRANNRYLPNSCVVLDRRLATGTIDDVVVGDDAPQTVQRPSYHPEIKIQYEVAGRKYEVWTYDAVFRFSTDRVAEQAIVDSFLVGATYPCWYDPERPDRAVLVRGHDWGADFAVIVPIVFLVFGGAGIRYWWRNRVHPRELEQRLRAGTKKLAVDPEI